jgi:hypothetical protein
MNHWMPHHLAAAQSLPEAVKDVTQGSGFKTNHILIVMGAGFAVAAILFLLIYFLKRGAKEEAERPRAPTQAPRPEKREGATEHRHRRRKRRRRRDHRPRNPSLQQTGGLPPPRPEDQPPAY